MSDVACGSEHQTAYNAWVVPALRVSISIAAPAGVCCSSHSLGVCAIAGLSNSAHAAQLRRCDRNDRHLIRRHAGPPKSEPHTRIREDAHSATLPPVCLSMILRPTGHVRQLPGASERAARTHTLPPRSGTPRDASHFFGDTCQVRPECEACRRAPPFTDDLRSVGPQPTRRCAAAHCREAEQSRARPLKTDRQQQQKKTCVFNFCWRLLGRTAAERCAAALARPRRPAELCTGARPRARSSNRTRGSAREATPGERARECANAHERDRAHARRGNEGRGGNASRRFRAAAPAL